MTPARGRVVDPRASATTVRLDLADDGQLQLWVGRRYGHPVHRVWQALTDSRRHGEWFGVRTDIEPVVKGSIRCWFCEQQPPVVGEVLEVRPPRLLVHTARGDVFRWELTPVTNGCDLVLIDTVHEPAHLPWSAAGFHGAFNLLQVQLDGGDPAAVREADDSWFGDTVGYYARILRPGADRDALPTSG